jgi:hypothetical protein
LANVGHFCEAVGRRGVVSGSPPPHGFHPDLAFGEAEVGDEGGDEWGAKIGCGKGTQAVDLHAPHLRAMGAHSSLYPVVGVVGLESDLEILELGDIVAL